MSVLFVGVTRPTSRSMQKQVTTCLLEPIAAHKHADDKPLVESCTSQPGDPNVTL